MSLIHHMLEDLERRRVRPSRAPLALLPAGRPATRRRWRLDPGAAGAALVVLALAVLVTRLPGLDPAGWLDALLSRAGEPSSTGLPPVSARHPQPPEALASLESIQVEAGPRPRLFLALDRATAHRLETSADGRKVSIRLFEAGVAWALARPALEAPLLDSLTVRELGSDVEIALRLSEPVEAIGHSEARDGRVALVVELLRRPPLAQVAPPTQAAPIWSEPPRSETRIVRRPASPTLAELAARALRRGDAALEAGDVETALGEFRRALETLPGNLRARERLARTLARSGRDDEALALLAADPPALGAHPDYHALRAALLERGGEHGRAAELYERLVRLDPQRAAWWLGLGVSLEGERRFADALRVYRAAAALDGLGAEPRSWALGRVQALAGAAPVP